MINFFFFFFITSEFHDVPVLVISPALTAGENVQERKQGTLMTFV